MRFGLVAFPRHGLLADAEAPKGRLGNKQGRNAVRRTWILIPAAVALLATSFGAPSTALAQSGELCNPVIDARRNAVIDARRNPVRHGGSFPCPPEPVAEPAPAMTPAPAPPPAPVVLSAEALFDFDSARLRPGELPELNSVAQRLLDNPDQRVSVIGHTDSTGSAAYNQGLSERRAQSVADYLAARGVARDRMVVQGRGLNEPVATNATREGRQQNRRVEIHTL